MFVCFLAHASNIWICIISRVCSAGRPAVLRGKNVNINYYAYTRNIFNKRLSSQPLTIDVYYNIFLSVALVLAEDHKVNGKPNPVFNFLAHFTTDQSGSFDVVEEFQTLNPIISLD